MATIDFTRINTNIAALNSLNTLRDVNKSLALAQTRLSTGRRINEAADDPAGLTLATKFDVRATGMQVAMDNIGDAKNLLAVAEGGLRKINEILGKMRAKAEAAASDTLGSAERNAIKADLEQFAKEIDDIVNTTTWNNQKLIDGTANFDFHTGAASTDFTTWALSQGHNSANLGINTITVNSAASARAYIGSLDTAIASVSASLSNIGSMVARLTFKEDTLAIGKVNTEAAYNRIMNADMALEQLNAVRYQILQQTAIAMLAQANVAPQAVLQLIGGR
jgi:flagellin